MFAATYSNLKKSVSYISFNNVKGDSQQDISNERNRRIALSFVFGLISKIINLALIFVTVRLTSHYLGVERYGIFMTLMTIVTLISFADLGLGLGLQNKVAENSNSEDKIKLLRDISSSFIFLLSFSLIFYIAFLIFNPFINWEVIFSLKDNVAKNEIYSSIFILFTCFVITIPLSIVQKIRNGFLEGYYNSLWQIVGNLISFILILISIHYKLGIPYLILATYSAISISLLFNWIHFFYKGKKELLPKFKYFSFGSAKNMFNIGIIFFLLQLFALIGTSADSFIIAHYLGVSYVATYAIGFRLQQILITPVQIYLEPLWPAYNEALHKNDIRWVKSAFNKTFLIVLLLSIFLGCIMIFLGKFIVNIWIGGLIKLDTVLLIAFASYIMYANITGVFCTLLNTSFFYKYQLIFLGITNITTITLKILFIKSIGVAGIVSLTFVVYLFLYFVPASLIIKKRIFNQTTI